MEDQEEVTLAGGQTRLTVNVGQTVIPIQGIVQREVVMAFVMAGHARVGRDSPVRILDNYPELLSLVCFFADIWREFHPGLVARCTWPGSSISFYIRSNLQNLISDPKFAPLVEPLPDRRWAGAARWLDRYWLQIVNLANPQPLTWTESEML